MTNNYCIFILSHDRAGNIPTISSLEESGYDGDWFILVDSGEHIDEYKDEYGDEKAIYVPKDDALPELDRGDNFDYRKTPLYTRYQVWDIADELGYNHFVMMDDDYTRFDWKLDENIEFGHTTRVENINQYIEAAIEYLNSSKVTTICMAQGGDYIGGEDATFVKKRKTDNHHIVRSRRKAMNVFVCQTDEPYEFRGSLNDDVNTYIREQQLGHVFLTPNILSLEQERTQQHDGGITELYLEAGTYVKSFYTVLYSPSSTGLYFLDDGADKRIHHDITWRNAVPKIVPESTKNGAN